MSGVTLQLSPPPQAVRDDKVVAPAQAGAQFAFRFERSTQGSTESIHRRLRNRGGMLLLRTSCGRIGEPMLKTVAIG